MKMLRSQGPLPQAARSAGLRRTRGWIAVAALGGLSVSCADTGTLLDTRTKQGAVLGGLLGAASSAAIASHNGARAWRAGALGAAVGALGGGLIGRYMDQQAAQLDAIPGARVEQRQDSLRVDFNSELLFDTGAAQLQAGAYERLRSLARTLNEYPESRVKIAGHTDSTGSESFNQRLSEERADRVRSFLISEGVASSRITAVGFGSSMPVASNATESGRAQNRRVEIDIVPDRDAIDRAPQS